MKSQVNMRLYSMAGLAFLTMLPFSSSLSTMPTMPTMSNLPNSSQISQQIQEKLNILKEKFISVCDHDQTPGDTVHCNSHVIAEPDGITPKAQVQPAGFGPNQIRSAYNVSGLASTKQTIAIVDAYDHSNILSDLNNYSQQFGLPTMHSCPVASGSVNAPCFQKVDQRGTTFYPRQDSGWALEIALDVEMAHAMCQNCNLLLVEANSNSYNNLFAAVDRAAIMGANEISLSWGGGEFSSESFYDSHLNRPGLAITVSSGDNGYGVEYPAASPYVIAVGGTSLLLNSDNSYSNELVWGGAGSGCSSFESKPAWQTDSGCSNRTVADVSAVADPNTGAAVYDSVRYAGVRGWFKVGGTSLASPVIASIYALAGGISGSSQLGSQIVYSNANSGNIHDILGGTNGSCVISYLCNGGSGFDGPSGIGSPNGSSAF